MAAPARAQRREGAYQRRLRTLQVRAMSARKQAIQAESHMEPPVPLVRFTTLTRPRHVITKGDPVKVRGLT